jgi:uncharacterized membrane protein
METPPHCTVPLSRRRLDPVLDLVLLLVLTAAVLLVHGFHPWAEDGGLYVAGVELQLHPTLFPLERVFVTEHTRYSVFAPCLAALVRVSHLSLLDVLLCVYLGTAALTLLAALRLVRQCTADPSAQWTAVGLLAACWTTPIAGTSLLLMDPYVTGRSLSTPLTLLAVDAALLPWSPAARRSRWRRLWSHKGVHCAMFLGAAALFHPLMAGYGVCFVFLLRVAARRQSHWTTLAIALAAVLSAGLLQLLSPPDSAAATAAAYSRYYWFLSQWQWYELLGLFAPLAILYAFDRWPPAWLTSQTRTLSRAALALGLLATGITTLFAQEHFRGHLVARLQPLRCFLLLYIIMFLLLGSVAGHSASRRAASARAGLRRRLIALSPACLLIAAASGLYAAQRASFPASLHLESPGRVNPNPWAEAFVWVRQHTPPNALFALDARYVNTPGEDAQTFRAIAQRSAIPDFSKDGGEAAITPSLAPEWQRAAQATAHLSDDTDTQRDRALARFHVTWLVLHANAVTAHPCPFRDETVKVCRLN